MRGTSPALSLSEIKLLATHPQTAYVDSDDDAEKGRVDTRDNCRQSFLASAPVPCNWLPPMMLPHAERMLKSLLPHVEISPILPRWKIFFIERFFGKTELRRASLPASRHGTGDDFSIRTATAPKPPMTSMHSIRIPCNATVWSAAGLVSSPQTKNKIYMLSCGGLRLIWQKQ